MKKVLIITYHWPPSGGITVLRCLKFAKYLREFDWEPVIFTAENASYQYLDYNNEKDIPEEIEVHRVPIKEPINWFKRLSGRKQTESVQNITSNSAKKKSIIDKFAMWVRGNFFIPDARCQWIKPSVRYLNNYLQEQSVDAILTDGPPHTNTVIGMRIAQKFNIPWLADFQDPWTQVDYYSKLYIGKRADKKHRKLEQEVFQTASKITIASPTWAKELENIGAKNVSPIFYGFDEDDFTNYSPKQPKKLTFFHGGLLGEDRNPTGFFEALKNMLEQQPSLCEKVEIRLAGEVDFSVQQAIEEYGLQENVTLLGMIPRSKVLQEMAQAFMLLLPVNKAKNAQGRIPGKLFEMMRSQKPILVFGPNKSDVQSIVETAKAGRSFEYNDVNKIQHFMENVLAGKYSIDFDKSKIQAYSNKKQTEKVANFLNEIVR